MKWFISQPMNGKTPEEIKKERNSIEEFIFEHDSEAEIIDSFFEDYYPCDGNIALKFLSRSIERLADADVAYFADGWYDSRGCVIEHNCAKAYGIQTVHDKLI